MNGRAKGSAADGLVGRLSPRVHCCVQRFCRAAAAALPAFSDSAFRCFTPARRRLIATPAAEKTSRPSEMRLGWDADGPTDRAIGRSNVDGTPRMLN